MPRRVSVNNLFMNCASRFKDLVYVSARDREFDALENDHSRFFGFYQGKSGHMGDRPWNTAAICVVKRPQEKMVAVGEDGDVFTYVGGAATDELIKPAPIVLRGLGVVEGFAFACGGGRQVFKRQGENSWSAMHAPAPIATEAVGFDDICGFSENEIYAVGWQGEIWQWSGKDWINRSSPTNINLAAVCCGGDNFVYACGQSGTLVRGRNDQWQMLDPGPSNEDFWDICWFNNRLYVAAFSVLYEYFDGQLVPVTFGDDVPASFGKLTEAEGVLWSVGASDVFSFDGSVWVRID